MISYIVLVAEWFCGLKKKIICRLHSGYGRLLIIVTIINHVKNIFL